MLHCPIDRDIWRLWCTWMNLVSIWCVHWLVKGITFLLQSTSSWKAGILKFIHRRKLTWVYFDDHDGGGISYVDLCRLTSASVLSRKATKRLAKVVTLDDIRTPPNSIIFCHGYMHHAGHERRAMHDLRNHIYFIPVLNGFKARTAFFFAWGI